MLGQVALHVAVAPAVGPVEPHVLGVRQDRRHNLVVVRQALAELPPHVRRVAAGQHAEEGWGLPLLWKGVAAAALVGLVVPLELGNCAGQCGHVSART